MSQTIPALYMYVLNTAYKLGMPYYPKPQLQLALLCADHISMYIILDGFTTYYLELHIQQCRCIYFHLSGDRSAVDARRIHCIGLHNWLQIHLSQRCHPCCPEDDLLERTSASRSHRLFGRCLGCWATYPASRWAAACACIGKRIRERSSCTVTCVLRFFCSCTGNSCVSRCAAAYQW